MAVVVIDNLSPPVHDGSRTGDTHVSPSDFISSATYDFAVTRVGWRLLAHQGPYAAGRRDTWPTDLPRSPIAAANKLCQVTKPSSPENKTDIGL
jgi:hypothetical protein